MTRSSLPLAAALLLVPVACDKSNSLGDVEDTGADDAADDGADDGDSGDSGDGGSEGGNDSADGGDDGADDGDSGEPLMCLPGESYVEPPACEVGTAPPVSEPGCFVECSEGQACPDGTTCQLVQYNPCPCDNPEGEGCCGACGAEASMCMPETFDAVCGAIVGHSFASIEELECGLTPEGPVPCHWTIDFEDDGDYLWRYSDIGEGGTYTCVDGVLTTMPAVTASYDPVTHILLWEGVEYQALPPT